MPTPSGQSALQAQINQLGERMDRGFSELKEIMTGVEGRVRGLETREAGCQPMVTSKIDAVAKRVDEHEAELKTLKENVAELKHSNRIMSWIGGLLSSTLIVWFISQLVRLIQ